MCSLLGTWPATQACAGTGNQTNDPLVHWPELNLLSYTSQGLYVLFYLILLTTFPSRYHWEVNYPFFKKNIFFIFRWGKGGRKRGREKLDVREKHPLVASLLHPDGGLNPQPRRVPWLGIKPLTFCFVQPTEPHQSGLFVSHFQPFLISMVHDCRGWCSSMD